MNDGGGVGPDGLGCDLRGGCEIRTREAVRRGMPFDIMDDDDDIGCGGGVRDSVVFICHRVLGIIAGCRNSGACKILSEIYSHAVRALCIISPLVSARALRFLNDVLGKNFGQFELDAW